MNSINTRVREPHIILRYTFTHGTELSAKTNVSRIFRLLSYNLQGFHYCLKTVDVDLRQHAVQHAVQNHLQEPAELQLRHLQAAELQELPQALLVPELDYSVPGWAELQPLAIIQRLLSKPQRFPHNTEYRVPYTARRQSR